jgi:hypothetical protein
MIVESRFAAASLTVFIGVTRYYFVVYENGDATHTFEAKIREANAVVSRRSSRNRRINLHDRKYVIVFGQGGRVFTSDVRHLHTAFNCTM